MEENINIKKLIELCKRRVLTILLTSFFIVCITSLLTFFVLEPKYEYSKQIMVGQLAFDNGTKDFALSSANLQLIRSYMDVINNPIVLESIISELNLKLSASALKEQIEIKNNENSQIVTITVSYPNPKLAKNIASLIAFRSKGMMNELTNYDYIHILDESNHATKPELVFPKPMLITVISVLFGLFTGLCIAIVKDGFDTTIKNEQELLSLVGLPHVGSLNTKERKHLRKTVIGKEGELFGVTQEKIQVS